MGIERVTKEEMHCSMGGCSNLVRDVGMREGEGVYTIEEIAIDAGWKIEEFNGGIIHVCPRCSSDIDALTAELDAANAALAALRNVVPEGEADGYEGRSCAVYAQWLCDIAAILYPSVKEAADLPTDSSLQPPG